MSMIVGLLLIFSLLFPVSASFSLEPAQADPVSIGKVLSAPQAYNLHRVRLQGSVTAINTVPNLGGCGQYDAYVFTIRDETGEIQAFDSGFCSEGNSAAPLLYFHPVKRGDRLVIAVTIIQSFVTGEPPLQAQLHWIEHVRE